MPERKIKNIEKRSGCPVSCSLEVIGDKWSLLIIRDILLFGKTTYNEFLASGEGISTNILNDRLVRLTELGLITFSGTEKRKKYTATKIGMDLKPVLESIAAFGMKYFDGSKQYVQKNFKPVKK
ncbi:MAG TPA: helix-turn-helix domain-containing protein [Bacteroidia bacterium]|nr:helix-turn-helix domain-containing protein [Bacteroidia bacterium]